MANSRNFDAAYKLHAATIKDEHRENARYVYFRDGYAYAANGYIAVKAKIQDISFGFTPAELASLDGKYIDGDLFKQLLSYDEAHITEKGFEIIDEKTPVVLGFCRELELKMPGIQNIFDTLESIAVKSFHILGINFQQLSKLQAAMGGSKRLQFHIFNNESAIAVFNDETGQGPDVKGIITPVLPKQID